MLYAVPLQPIHFALRGWQTFDLSFVYIHFSSPSRSHSLCHLFWINWKKLNTIWVRILFCHCKSLTHIYYTHWLYKIATITAAAAEALASAPSGLFFVVYHFVIDVNSKWIERGWSNWSLSFAQFPFEPVFDVDFSHTHFRNISARQYWICKRKRCKSVYCCSFFLSHTHPHTLHLPLFVTLLALAFTMKSLQRHITCR